MKVENTWNSITWSNRFSVITSRRGNKNDTSLDVIHSLYCPLRKIYKSLAVNICVMIQQSKIYIFRRRWSLDGYEIKYFWLIVYNLLLNAIWSCSLSLTSIMIYLFPTDFQIFQKAVPNHRDCPCNLPEYGFERHCVQTHLDYRQKFCLQSWYEYDT